MTAARTAPEVTERPISMGALSIRALLGGDKTQHCIPLLNVPGFPVRYDGLCLDGRPRLHYWEELDADGEGTERYIPFDLPFSVGDHLWVQEDFRLSWTPCKGCGLRYLADDTERWQDKKEFDPWVDGEDQWHVLYKLPPPLVCDFPPRIHRDASTMPRWASRLVLLVTDIRVHQLWETSIPDIQAQGCVGSPYGSTGDFAVFPAYWNSIHGNTPGASHCDNPWVYVLTFTCMEVPYNG